jgi:hypothetical protein
LSVLGGGTRHPRSSPKTAACLLLLAVAGCGPGGGVASGATVTAYVEASLCAGARRELASEHGEAGSLRIRAVCLPSPSSGRKLNLAILDANARRAVEDSTAVGYIGDANPTARRFSQPILESAGIASIYSSSGATAMAQLLAAIHRAGGGSNLREAVRDNLAGS